VLVNADIRFDLDAETDIIIKSQDQNLFSMTMIRGTMGIFSIARKRVELELSQTIVGIDSFKSVLNEDINFIDNPDETLQLANSINVSSSYDASVNTIQAFRGDFKVLIRETQEVIDLKQGHEMKIKKNAKFEIRLIKQ
jgi:hypothetical protein